MCRLQTVQINVQVFQEGFYTYSKRSDGPRSSFIKLQKLGVKDSTVSRVIFVCFEFDCILQVLGALTEGGLSSLHIKALYW